MNSLAVLYQRTQVGTVQVAFLVACIALWVYFLAIAAYIPAIVGLMLISLVLLLFHSLTVKVTPGLVSLRFGVGMIHKRFKISEIETVEPVRNRWFYGWGIRWTPHGWLFNVSGLDAVQIRLRSGRQYRIGTDQPQHLCRAIEEALSLQSSSGG